MKRAGPVVVEQQMESTPCILFKPFKRNIKPPYVHRRIDVGEVRISIVEEGRLVDLIYAIKSFPFRDTVGLMDN